MSIVNHTHRFIFVHIPKTAGTTVTSLLSRYTNYCDLEIGGTEFGEALQPHYARRFGLSKHITAVALRRIVGEDCWSRYFKFSLVRNPYARAISTFDFLRKWQGPSLAFQSRMKSFASFEEYVLSDIWTQTDGPDGIFRPQASWLLPAAGRLRNAPLVDYVGRVEDIADEIPKILEAIGVGDDGISRTKIPHLNRRKPAAVLDASASAVVERIDAKYRIDFELFDYRRFSD